MCILTELFSIYVFRQFYNINQTAETIYFKVTHVYGFVCFLLDQNVSAMYVSGVITQFD